MQASGERKLISSEKNTLRIGRLAESEIFIDEPVVSRKHAEIYFTDNDFYVEDSGSRNGTLVNAKQVSAPTRLTIGDTIGVGSAKIIYQQAQNLYPEAEPDLTAMTVIMGAPQAASVPETAVPLELLETVADISRQLLQNRPLEALLDYVLELCLKKTSAERAAILLRDENGALVTRAYLSKGKSHPRFTFSRTIAQKALAEDRAILIEDVGNAAELNLKESVLGLEIRSAICTPMWHDSQSVGALYIDSILAERRFDKTDLLFFTTLAGLITEKIAKAILAPWQLKIHTFGRFVLIKDGEPVTFRGKAQKRPIEMLKAIIAFGGREVSEERLVDALWPDAEGDLGHQTFNTTLHRLRKIIGKEMIQVNGGRVTLDSSRCWVDVWAFERLLGEAEPGWRSEDPKQQKEAASLTEKAMSMNFAPFLQADMEMEWTIMLRERLQSKFLRNISRLGNYLVEKGETEKALEIFQKGVEMAPMIEEFYHQIMLCQVSLGRPAEARNTYQQCHRVLLSGEGLEPSEKIRTVYYSLGGSDDGN